MNVKKIGGLAPRRYGEENNFSRLTREQVHEIITSTEKPTIIAKKFGITYGHVWNIRTGRAWKEALEQ